MSKGRSVFDTLPIGPTYYDEHNFSWMKNNYIYLNTFHTILFIQ